MLLMLLFTCGIVVFMPKLMESMDPEEMKQMQKQMGSAQDPVRPGADVIPRRASSCGSSMSNSSTRVSSRTSRNAQASMLKSMLGMKEDSDSEDEQPKPGKIKGK